MLNGIDQKVLHAGCRWEAWRGGIQMPIFERFHKTKSNGDSTEYSFQGKDPERIAGDYVTHIDTV